MDRLKTILEGLPIKGDGLRPDYREMAKFCTQAKSKGWTVSDCYDILKEKGYEINMSVRTFKTLISKYKNEN